MPSRLKAVNPRKAGRAMTSRDSQEVRHMAAARQARSGRPRWPNEAASPMTPSPRMIHRLRLQNASQEALCAAPNSAGSATTTPSPCAQPTRVVSNKTENAGRMTLASLQLSDLDGLVARARWRGLGERAEQLGEQPARFDFQHRFTRGRAHRSGLWARRGLVRRRGLCVRRCSAMRQLTRQIVIGRTGAEFGHQGIAAALADGARHLGIGVVHIAEQPCVGRAGVDAGRAALRLRNALVVDAIDAQSALGHHPAVFVVFASAVGAGPGAVFTADALVAIDQHDAVFLAFVRRAGRANGHAGRLFAVQAALGKVHGLRLRKLTDLVGLHPVEKHPQRILAVGFVVAQMPGRTGGVPLFAGSDAGVAAHADIEVDDQGELGHGCFPWRDERPAK